MRNEFQKKRESKRERERERFTKSDEKNVYNKFAARASKIKS